MAITVGNGDYRYEVDANWSKIPEGWDAPMAAVAVDSRDRVYGFNRGEHRVIVFDRHGDFLYSWGDGLFPFPHAILADSKDNIWLVERNDCQIMKFTPEGELIMTIGVKGYRSNTGVDPTDFSSTSFEKVTHGGGPFNLPAGVAVAPSGDIFIADGYANCQIHRFSADGQHKFSWGEPGSGPGQFRLPHGIWIDSDDRVLVADRENDRIQIFTQDGKFITTWETEFIGPAAFYVGNDGIVYVPEHNGGFFSVLTKDGNRLARWGSEANKSCHGVAGDSHGDIYFVQRVESGEPRRLVKYIRQA